MMSMSNSPHPSSCILNGGAVNAMTIHSISVINSKGVLLRRAIKAKCIYFGLRVCQTKDGAYITLY